MDEDVTRLSTSRLITLHTCRDELTKLDDPDDMIRRCVSADRALGSRSQSRDDARREAERAVRALALGVAAEIDRRFPIPA